MAKLYDVVTALDICADLIVAGNVLPEFGQSEKLVEDYTLEMGGSNCIFACQAARLGLKTAGVGIYGSDVLGRLVCDALNAAGVDTSHLREDAACKTALSIALCQKEDRAILTCPGTIAAPGLERPLGRLIPHSRLLHIGSYYLLEQLWPCYPGLVRSARESGTLISLDTNWDPRGVWRNGLEELLPQVDVFLPNENEAMAIAREGDPVKAARALSRYAKVVVLKRGQQGGGVYVGGEEVAALPSLPVDMADTIGAGDSFDAGFLYGYLLGEPLQRCLWYAIACGSMSTRARGGVAAQFRLAELLELARAQGQ